MSARINVRLLHFVGRPTRNLIHRCPLAGMVWRRLDHGRNPPALVRTVHGVVATKVFADGCRRLLLRALLRHGVHKGVRQWCEVAAYQPPPEPARHRRTVPSPPALRPGETVAIRCTSRRITSIASARSSDRFADELAEIDHHVGIEQAAGQLARVDMAGAELALGGDQIVERREVVRLRLLRVYGKAMGDVYGGVGARHQVPT